MGLPNPIAIRKDRCYVYKTGLPFYDAARLIGVAHLFFGTASAEVEDKGAYWEVSGVHVKRDKSLVSWVLNEGKSKAWDLAQKEEQIEKAFRDIEGDTECPQFNGLPVSKGYPALKEFDAALQYGPRGVDPLSDAVLVSSQGTKPKKQRKNIKFHHVTLLPHPLDSHFQPLLDLVSKELTFFLYSAKGSC
jgi:hypothetical protein